MAAIEDLVNAALRLVKGNRITSLTDGSKNANAANDVFPFVRDDLLSSHSWKFATKRVKLGRISAVPVSGFDYGYALPSDWIRTVSVHDNDRENGSINYAEAELNSQGAILTDAADVYLVYVYRCVDPNRWSVDFIAAFETALAAKLAIPVANSNTLKQELEVEARTDLAKAKSKDAMGSSPVQRPRGTWATSRGGWRNC